MDVRSRDRTPPGEEPAPAASKSRLPRSVRRVVECARGRKAIDLRVLDLRGLSDATDFFVIATGRSDIHVRAIADHILQATRAPELRPAHIEGLDDGRWVLIDYIDHIVHVFHPELRDFYRLETLWGDAPVLESEGSGQDERTEDRSTADDPAVDENPVGP